ncbi:MAG: hypothetical protein BWY80_01054 [Firmicutes bacterium ADurb.Bin456]|nr:MAG: hypothetical protein BWY80_01054 [Firmicutes bacterium ADurb.Bin456]
MGQVVFGRYDQTGSVFIQPVHDPRPRYSADPRQIPAVVQQRVDQSAGIIALGRMDHHSPGLIHNNDIAVLVINIQGDRLAF